MPNVVVIYIYIYIKGNLESWVIQYRLDSLLPYQHKIEPCSQCLELYFQAVPLKEKNFIRNPENIYVIGFQ